MSDGPDTTRGHLKGCQPFTAGRRPLDQPHQPVDDAVLQAREICDCYGLNACEALHRGCEHPFVRYLAPVLRAKDEEIERLRRSGHGALQLVARLHEEGVLSEGQCCRALSMDRVAFRTLCDGFANGADHG